MYDIKCTYIWYDPLTTLLDPSALNAMIATTHKTSIPTPTQEKIVMTTITTHIYIYIYITRLDLTAGGHGRSIKWGRACQVHRGGINYGWTL